MQYATEYQKALETTLANSLARSGTRETTQTGKTKEELLKRAPGERIEDLLRRLEKGEEESRCSPLKKSRI